MWLCTLLACYEIVIDCLKQTVGREKKKQERRKEEKALN